MDIDLHLYSNLMTLSHQITMTKRCVESMFWCINVNCFIILKKGFS